MLQPCKGPGQLSCTCRPHNLGEGMRDLQRTQGSIFATKSSLQSFCGSGRSGSSASWHGTSVGCSECSQVLFWLCARQHQMTSQPCRKDARLPPDPKLNFGYENTFSVLPRFGKLWVLCFLARHLRRVLRAFAGYFWLCARQQTCAMPWPPGKFSSQFIVGILRALLHYGCTLLLCSCGCCSCTRIVRDACAW